MAIDNWQCLVLPLLIDHAQGRLDAESYVLQRKVL
jgi:hypothetical protein